MKRKSLSLALLSLFSPFAWALTPFVVKDIRVEGIQRTEAGTVFNYLPIRIGDTINDDRVSQAIKALYATGFFKDVRIESEGNVLVVIVEERPAIARISFSGNKEFDTELLAKGLKDVGIAEARTFDRSVLERSEQEIKRLYLTKSFYAVRIKTTVSPLERNRVAVNFEIEEGDVARIKGIRIIGATEGREKILLNRMALDTPSWIRWFDSASKYSRAALLGDLEEIRSYYLDRGYADFSIESSQVSISSDRQDVFITIAIKEGAQYRVGAVKLTGDLLIPEAELRKLVQVKPGDVFSREALNETNRKITNRLGNDGYAFASVNVQPELDRDKRQVALTFLVDPGRRAYVNRITVSGNEKTRDEIIRRELRQMESAWFDRESVDRSKRRIDRTGFFEDVAIDTKPVEGSTDQVDINVAVKEKATGSLSFGVGYSQVDKTVLSASVSQENLFGSGNSLGLAFNTGKTSQTLRLSYTNPYYTTEGVSRGFDVYRSRVDPSTTSVAPYKSVSEGTGVRFGVPVTEDDTINFGLSLDRTRITTTDDSPQTYVDFVNEYGSTNTTLALKLGWARDQRDSVIYPTTGTYQNLSTELAIPPAELQYFRANYQWQRFFPLSKTYTLMLNNQLGYGRGYGDKSLPFFKNYYAGGIGSVRGYDDSSLGPRVLDSSGNQTTQALGGNFLFVTNAELLFPFPGMKEKERSVRLSLFLDGGNVWAGARSASFADIRWSTGVALTWASPVGPLKFSLGFPIKKREDDKTQKFQFQLGTVF